VPKEDLLRFLRKVDIEPGGCWVWTGHRRPTGYHYVRDTRTTVASRLAYLMFIGDLDDVTQVHHLCQNTACVKPDHLEAVDPGENVRRGSGEWVTCDRLHPDDPTRIGQRKDGRSYCKECQRVRERQRRAAFAEKIKRMRSL
jgi:hypothetical protein